VVCLAATWDPGLTGLAPFQLVGPLLVLAGVAAAFVPALDPSYRLAVAVPFSGLTGWHCGSPVGV